MKNEIFTFKVQGDLLGYSNYVQVGIYSSAPNLPAKEIIFFYLREEWDLLISHGAASLCDDEPQGLTISNSALPS